MPIQPRLSVSIGSLYVSNIELHHTSTDIKKYFLHQAIILRKVGYLACIAFYPCVMLVSLTQQNGNITASNEDHQ